MWDMCVCIRTLCLQSLVTQWSLQEITPTQGTPESARYTSSVQLLSAAVIKVILIWLIHKKWLKLIILKSLPYRALARITCTLCSKPWCRQVHKLCSTWPSNSCSLTDSLSIRTHSQCLQYLRDLQLLSPISSPMQTSSVEWYGQVREPCSQHRVREDVVSHHPCTHHRNTHVSLIVQNHQQ